MDLKKKYIIFKIGFKEKFIDFQDFFGFSIFGHLFLSIFQNPKYFSLFYRILLKKRHYDHKALIIF
jgi:hypothetical protein